SVESAPVVISIEEKAKDFMRKDVKATLGTEGLTGQAIISRGGRGASVPATEPGDSMGRGPGRGLDQGMDLVKDNGQNLSVITQNFAALSQRLVDGKGTVGAMFTDEQLANNLRQSSVALNAMLQNTNKAVNNLVALSAKLNSDQGLIHDL